MATVARAPRRSARYMWLVGISSALLVLLALLAVAEARSDPRAEIRVVPTGSRLSAEIVDGTHRVLIINATQPADARSALGRLGRPWESQAATLIAPADDLAAVGLWEAIQRLEPRQVFVIGVPDGGTTWSAIDQHAREQDIDLRYVSQDAVLTLDELTLSLFPPSSVTSRDPAVVARHGNVNIAFALGSVLPKIPTQLVVTAGIPSAPTSAALLITGRTPPGPRSQPTMQIDSADRLVIHFDGHRVQLTGGDYAAASP